ncbi:MAG: hypothetical protein AAFX06_27260 [Planctomycetota bacterium]
MRLIFSLLIGCFVGVYSDASTSTVFDFESIAVPQGSPRVNFTNPLTITQDGFSMTISHENDVVFSVNALEGVPLFNAQFESQALSAFNGLNGATMEGAFILDFDQTLNGIAVEMGDFGDEIDDLVLQAFDGIGGTGNLLASDSGTLPQGGNTFGFETLSVNVDGIRSVRMIGGGTNFPNSVFYDNIVVTAIPEPSACVLLLLGSTVLATRRRTRFQGIG